MFMRGIGLLFLSSWLAAGCGDGTTPPMPVSAEFLTADTRGIASSLDPTAGAPAPPSDATEFGAAAQDAQQQIAREIEEADLYRVSGDFCICLILPGPRDHRSRKVRVVAVAAAGP
jgi:hypothetical protein